jgi:hypothetical protein
MDRLRGLVDEVCRGLPVGLHRAEDIRLELLHHLDDAVRELEAAGLTHDEAVEQAAVRFGDPSEVRAKFVQDLQGGRGVMWRRVIVPALLTAGGVMALVALGSGMAVFNRYWVEGSSQGRHAGWPGPIPLPVGWLEIPIVFAGCYLCGLRGGTKRECIAVGLSPLAWVVPASICYMVALGFGSVAAHTMTLGEAVARSAYLSMVLDWVGKCAAGTVLYLIAFHRIEIGGRQAAAEPTAAPEQAGLS